MIRRYLLYLEECRRNPGGLHAAFRAIRAFRLWYQEENDLTGWSNPVHKVKAPKNQSEPIEPVSMATVKAMVNACPKTFHGPRDAALLYFLTDTGTRAAECLAVDLVDVDQVSGAVLIREGKMKRYLVILLVFLTGCTAWGFAPIPRAYPTPLAAATRPTTRSPVSATTSTIVSAAAATRTPIPTPTSCIVVNTKGESLNIRRQPSLQAEIIGGLMPGQRVTVITWGEAWHKVTAGQLTGFISSKYCR
jgi:integrase